MLKTVITIGLIVLCLILIYLSRRISVLFRLISLKNKHIIEDFRINPRNFFFGSLRSKGADFITISNRRVLAFKIIGRVGKRKTYRFIDAENVVVASVYPVPLPLPIFFVRISKHAGKSVRLNIDMTGDLRKIKIEMGDKGATLEFSQALLFHPVPLSAIDGNTGTELYPGDKLFGRTVTTKKRLHETV